MKKAYILDPRDKLALLTALMRMLAGDAHIALEGDIEAMSEMDFGTIPGVIENVLPPFRREWNGDSKFIVIPLTPQTIAPILKEVLPEGRIVHKIGAIQIERHGEIQFFAGDNFHRECVSVGQAVPVELLGDLVISGVLRAYYTPEEAKLHFKHYQL